MALAVTQLAAGIWLPTKLYSLLVFYGAAVRLRFFILRGMSRVLIMKGYALGLFDKLMAGSSGASSNVVASLTLEEMKDVVAKDLESLLNTRTVMSEMLLSRYPECSKSIINYGLNDFAGLSLSSANDRNYICRSLEQAIARHEPRLRNVSASLELEDGSTNRLNFAIAALLVLKMEQEPVNFDAVLQPSSLQYTITKARRAART